ncbi:MAG: hypothetical protein NTZ94_02405 [Verrucomicrobia bacterium]|nr:hypothetical protein [Verrucomicrobiota bacterium]
MPRDTAEFKIAKEPQHGTLEGPDRIDRESVRYLYRNNGEKGIDADRVDFKIKTGPANAWGRVTARIIIEDRPSRLDVENEILNFGDCPIGRQGSLPLVIRNGGGGVLRRANYKCVFRRCGPGSSGVSWSFRADPSPLGGWN